MKKLTPHEKSILELHKKNNFCDVSKDNVKEVVSIFEKLDPDVAKALIEQMPEAIRGMVEIEKVYKDLLIKGIDSCETTVRSCYESEDIIINTAVEEASKDIPFEEKQFYFEQMKAAAERKEKKDTEHRSTVDTWLKYGGIALAFAAGVIATIFLGGNGGTSVSRD